MTSPQEGDLGSYLKARGGRLLDEREVMGKLVQLCLGLQHVHSKARRRSMPLGLYAYGPL